MNYVRVSRLLAATTLFFCLRSSASAEEPPLKPGTHAPQFSTSTIDGKPLTLRSLHGQVVLLDFWATWCGPCHMATPMLQQLHKQFTDKGLRVVGMSIDDPGYQSQVKEFRKALGVTYTLAYAPKENYRAAMAYHTNMDPDNPTTKIDHPVPPAIFLIDRKGVVRWSQIGYSKDEKQELTNLIKKYL